jgi:Raf kinase inhibitor-like YbhB/YbcL family protein
MLLLAAVDPASAARKGGTMMGELRITSPAFSHASSIPAVYTCDGRDGSPPLVIAGVPDGAQSLALIMDDPDAPVGTWVHWVAWNIPPTTAAIGAGLPSGSVEGRNSWQRTGYGGPCPPSGSHRYFFRLYALDTLLHLPVTAGKAEVERAMKGHVLAQAELMGTYKRR